MNKKHFLVPFLALAVIVTGSMYITNTSVGSSGVTAAVSDMFKGIFSRVPSFKLRLWVPFEEEAGSSFVKDKSGKVGSGTLSGDPTSTIGVKDNALSFDGVNDYVAMPYDSDYNVTAKYTLSAWVKLENVFGAGGTILSKEDIGENTSGGYVLSVAPDAIDFVVRGRSEVSVPVEFTPDVWHHVVVVHVGIASPSTRFYVDGVEVAAESLNSPSRVIVPLLVGRDGPGENFFKGEIDEVRVYTRDLSPRQIIELYLAERPEGAGE